MLDDNDRLFDTVSASRLLGVSNKTLAMWTARGFITPADEKELGRRKKYYYFNFYNLVELQVLNIFGRQHRLEYGLIQKILVVLRNHLAHSGDIRMLPPLLVSAQLDEKTGKTSIKILAIDRSKPFGRVVQPDVAYCHGAIFIDLASIAEDLVRKIEKQS
ncbi:MAG: hypothetical protein RB296_06795 [Acidobacteriota bacterium]|jgi:DNA-binding transcriptional MerR regulator|nr:hypothetical protein [Acidobacteriota bacterium]